MKKEEVVIFSHATNLVIIQTPGRRFPGSVIQGDSLNYLFRLSQRIVGLLSEKREISEALIEHAEEVHELLYERLLNYQGALKNAGIELPYFPELQENDLLTKSE